MNILELDSQEQHVQKTLEILREQENKEYLLMLSGGQPPIDLYNHMSFSFGYPFPNDVAMVDERWGENAQHEKSNALIIKNSGLMGRMRWENANFHPILGSNPSKPKVEASAYEKELLGLFENYNKRMVVILGMGLDGHIAGILPDSEGVESNEHFISYESNDEHGYRLTVTFSCLIEYFHNVILLLDGDEKCGVFNRIMNFETDVRKFPVLVLKNVSNVNVLCYSFD